MDPRTSTVREDGNALDSAIYLVGIQETKLDGSKRRWRSVEQLEELYSYKNMQTQRIAMSDPSAELLASWRRPHFGFSKPMIHVKTGVIYQSLESDPVRTAV